VERVDVLIVGAGPSGLAMAASLRRRGLPFLLIESAPHVGASWRRHYDRLHLHTVKTHSALPGLAFPRDVPRYPSRSQVVDYLERYASRFDVRPRFGERLECARRAAPSGAHDAAWDVRTSGGSYRTQHLVIATGLSREPVRPDWPERGVFPGRILHSADYRNGGAFRGARALVVGLGNSGAEIALDLHESGARVALSVRSPQNILPREFLGTPLQVTSIRTSFLPVAVRDRLGRLTSRLAFGDLSPYGLMSPPYGPVSQMVKHGRTPVLDVGTVARVRSGDINVVAGPAAFTHTGVRCTDGRLVEADVIVLATGYEPALHTFIDAPELFDDTGRPARPQRSHAARNIHFLGFRNALTGLLRQTGIEAERLAATLARSR
jgi:cation diffusion facilitator CzcD-associated flavoprotein CzcO